MPERRPCWNELRPGVETVELSDRTINERAHQIWTQRGRPSGDGMEDWLRARAELARARDLFREMEAGPFAGPSHLLSALMDNSEALIHVKDTGGRYLMVNARFAALY